MIPKHRCSWRTRTSFQALDSGLIDCTATFDVSIRAYRQHEAVNRYLEIDYGNLSSNIPAINKDIFESMAAEDQEILMQLGRDYIDDYSARIAAESAAMREIMRTGAEGPEVTFVQLSEEEHARIIGLAIALLLIALGVEIAYALGNVCYRAGMTT